MTEGAFIALLIILVVIGLAFVAAGVWGHLTTPEDR